MSRKAAKILYFVNIFGGAILFAGLLSFDLIGLANIVAVAMLAVGMYSCYQLRCPACGRWPGKGGMFAHYCPRCGEPLDNE